MDPTDTGTRTRKKSGYKGWGWGRREGGVTEIEQTFLVSCVLQSTYRVETGPFPRTSGSWDRPWTWLGDSGRTPELRQVHGGRPGQGNPVPLPYR